MALDQSIPSYCPICRWYRADPSGKCVICGSVLLGTNPRVAKELQAVKNWRQDPMFTTLPHPDAKPAFRKKFRL